MADKCEATLVAVGVVGVTEGLTGVVGGLIGTPGQTGVGETGVDCGGRLWGVVGGETATIKTTNKNNQTINQSKR